MRATSMLVLVGLTSSAEARPDLSLSGNLGFGGPGGVFAVMARLDITRWLFIEGDAGFSTAGPELGGGVGFAPYEEHGALASLGPYRTRLTFSALATRSSTSDRDAGTPGAPWPELVVGSGTYTWGYLMAGVDLTLENRLYLFSELGVAARFGLERDSAMAYEPSPDASVGPAIRAGIGVTL